MDRQQIDLGAGLLLLIAIVSLAFIALRAANFDALGGASTYSLAVSFENIGNLKAQSPVKSSGIIVGRIAALSLDQENFEAIAHVDIDQRYSFPDDSTFAIVSTNLLGEQYINIVAGGSETALADGDRALGNSALILEDLIGKFIFDKAAE
ncbi:MAG: outer membrane lipid asymmetry maintenance protein MlaD [Betaproteobacteria bacterium AqS2]|uniref:Outer membrane lipid asymmetry maintenance protein MlaD n=1 Tax=Candidatus Amphirhobacter heronislandensis TaxID=1732024 RepID=A0A930Y1W2_9GAMM|nr:outer membrane lipid asymmetry maintenance protein MlaD [Betaproteobacteria bacterium AqS2]